MARVPVVLLNKTTRLWEGRPVFYKEITNWVSCMWRRTPRNLTAYLHMAHSILTDYLKRIPSQMMWHPGLRCPVHYRGTLFPESREFVHLLLGHSYALQSWGVPWWGRRERLLGLQIRAAIFLKKIWKT